MGINVNEPEADRPAPLVQSQAVDELIDLVGEASRESFPASDSPAWAMGRELSPRLDISNNQANNRFEACLAGKIAFMAYRRKPQELVFIHTEVPGELAGQGVGSKLAQAGLEFAREHGLKVVPLCPFVAGYIRRRQEYLDLVRPDYRARVTSEPVIG
jgi:uncharacterized protein